MLFLPGLALVRLFRLDFGPVERLAVALGLSLAAWPLALLVTPHIWGRGMVALAVGGSVLLLIVPLRPGRQEEPSRPASGDTSAGTATSPDRPGWEVPHPGAVVVALAVLVLTSLLVRIAQAADVLVPLWVDGLHHTEIVARMLETGGLPDALRPYMPVDRFYYHFGFHGVASAAAWLAGSDAAHAVLWTGQALSGLAPLTLYFLARETGARRVGALAAAALVATWYWFPMYFLSWSRYTQLAGLNLLPAAWVLAHRAARDGGRGNIIAAGIASGGLVLVHYRVATVFAIGAFLYACHRLLFRRGGMANLVAAGALAALAVGPWLAGPFLAGVADLAAAGKELAAPPGGVAPDWYSAPEGAGNVPPWLFTQRTNGVWLVLGAAGLVIGSVRRNAAAVGAIATGSLAALSANAQVIGLPATWMLPNFALAIGLYLPAGLGLAFLVSAFFDFADARSPSAKPLASWAIVAIVGGALLGAFDLGDAVAAARRGDGLTLDVVDVINETTRLVHPPDLAAAKWIEGHTPSDSIFLVSTAHWHLGTYRGLDGGYWLPVLARRATNIPGALYPYGPPEEVRRITALSVRLEAGDGLTDPELSALIAETGASYVYVGPAGADLPGKLTAERLRTHPLLSIVYEAGGVTVFEVDQG